MVGARKQVNVVFPYKMYEQLVKIAKKRDVPVAAVVRDEISSLIDMEAKKK
jgi:protein-arginine kinase activator protein McsA